MGTEIATRVPDPTDLIGRRFAVDEKEHPGDCITPEISPQGEHCIGPSVATRLATGHLPGLDESIWQRDITLFAALRELAIEQPPILRGLAADLLHLEGRAFGGGQTVAPLAVHGRAQGSGFLREVDAHRGMTGHDPDKAANTGCVGTHRIGREQDRPRPAHRRAALEQATGALAVGRQQIG